METAELAFQLHRSWKSFDGISFGQLNADTVGVRITEIDVDGMRALCDVRHTEPFAEHIDRDKQAVPRFILLQADITCIGLLDLGIYRFE